MQKWILYNWLILAVLSFFVAIYIAIFEHFFKDKGYLYVILAIVFGILYYRKSKVVKG